MTNAEIARSFAGKLGAYELAVKILGDAAQLEIVENLALVIRSYGDRRAAAQCEACAEFVENGALGWKTHAEIAAAIRRSLG